MTAPPTASVLAAARGRAVRRKSDMASPVPKTLLCLRVSRQNTPGTLARAGTLPARPRTSLPHLAFLARKRPAPAGLCTAARSFPSLCAWRSRPPGPRAGVPSSYLHPWLLSGPCLTLWPRCCSFSLLLVRVRLPFSRPCSGPGAWLSDNRGFLQRLQRCRPVPGREPGSPRSSTETGRRGSPGRCGAAVFT